jgi:hypothetical protein
LTKLRTAKDLQLKKIYNCKGWAEIRSLAGNALGKVS